MDFDPLELFSAAPSSYIEYNSPNDESQTNTLNSGKILQSSSSDSYEQIETITDFQNDDEEDTEFPPVHIHDLPLLRNSPPHHVLLAFLRLLSPETSLNFAPRGQTDSEDAKTDPVEALNAKNVDVDHISWSWLSRFCTRFDTLPKLASLSSLAGSFKTTFASQYNAWLTQLVSSELAWLTETEATEIQALAALRLAENCGRTAQPEILRSIEIPSLQNKLVLKEPSLTSDNLGLKTWGSSFILGSRLASQPQKKYLLDPVLELGAGTGLVGMVACCLGHRTVLTDLDEIVPNLLSNIKSNDIGNAEVAELDWSAPSGFLQKFGSLKYSTIILSDPLYSSQHPPWIVNMINLFLDDSKDARVLIQVPVRKSFEKERASLWSLMQTNGYTIEEECEESGYDDFGESSFLFKKYVCGSHRA